MIDMEINFLKNNEYENLEIIKNEINNLKMFNSRNWVYYNIASVDIKSLNADFVMKYPFSAILGIIIGLFYTFIVYYRPQSQKIIRNKKSN